MKKQEHNTTKTSFLTKFKNTKIGVKVIIIGGILALVATTIIVPIVVANKGDSSNQINQPGINELTPKPNPQGVTDQYIPWNLAYKESTQQTAENKYDYINDIVSTSLNNHPGNMAFSNSKLDDYNIEFSLIEKWGIDKDRVFKNKSDNLTLKPYIRFVGYDFATKKTFANVFYQLKKYSTTDDTPWYYETIVIKGLGAPKILPTRDASIAEKEFRGIVLPNSFKVSDDLSTVVKHAFWGATFTKDAKFSLAQTKVKSISESAFSYAKLPNGFVLNPATNSIGNSAFDGTTFDKEAKFSLAQTQVKSIPAQAFALATLPNGFALNDETNLIGINAFWSATFDKEAKFSLAQTQVKSIPTQAFQSAKLPNGFTLNDETNLIETHAFYEAKFDNKAQFSLAQTQVKSITASAFVFATLPNGFTLNSETNFIGENTFYRATFDQEAKFSLAKTQVKSIPAQAFQSAKLPNGFALNPATNSIEQSAFSGVVFDKEAKFSLAQTQVKLIYDYAFSYATLPNGFALNPLTNSIGSVAFAGAHLNPEFKIPDTVTSIAQDAFKDAILPSGYAWYDKDNNKQTITATNYPKAGWYVGKI